MSWAQAGLVRPIVRGVARRRAVRKSWAREAFLVDLGWLMRVEGVQGEVVLGSARVRFAGPAMRELLGVDRCHFWARSGC